MQALAPQVANPVPHPPSSAASGWPSVPVPAPVPAYAWSGAQRAWLAESIAPEVTRRDRYDATAAHLMMFATWFVGLPLPLLNLVAAVVFWAAMSKRCAFVRYHALQSLLAQVAVTGTNVVAIALLLAGVWLGMAAMCLVPIVIAGVANIAYLVCSVLAAGAAHRGEAYAMPIFGAIARRKVLDAEGFALDRHADGAVPA